MLNHNNYLQAVSLTFKQQALKSGGAYQGLQSELHFSLWKKDSICFIFVLFL